MCDSNLIKNLQMSEQNNLKSEQSTKSEENNNNKNNKSKTMTMMMKNKNKKGVK